MKNLDIKQISSESTTIKIFKVIFAGKALHFFGQLFQVSIHVRPCYP